MKLASLIRKRPREVVATAIPAIPATEPRSRASAVARIATVAVANASQGGQETATNDPTAAPAARWLLHFLDRQPTEVWFSPAVTHDEALGAYPDAVAAESLTERTDTCTAANVIERDELMSLVEAIYSEDTDQDRQEAIEAALADPGGALQCYRTIAAERGIEPSAPVRMLVRTEIAVRGCSTCRYRKRPGLSSPGNCGGGRDDLPCAYGEHHSLNRLPADLGVTCTSYTSHEG